MQKIVLTVEEAVDGNLYIRLPDDFIEQLGWQPDDVITWSENADKSFTLRKSE
jgi:hypothetical protein